MGCSSQSSPSQHTQSKAEQHQRRVFLTVQWLQSKQNMKDFRGQLLSPNLYRYFHHGSDPLTQFFIKKNKKNPISSDNN